MKKTILAAFVLCAFLTGPLIAESSSKKFVVSLEKTNLDRDLLVGLERGQKILILKGNFYPKFVKLAQAVTTLDSLKNVKILGDIWLASSVVVTATEDEADILSSLNFVDSVNLDNDNGGITTPEN